VDVETNQTALECWLRENAMPLGWNEELAEESRQLRAEFPGKSLARVAG
jgi:hypothetical protein